MQNAVQERPNAPLAQFDAGAVTHIDPMMRMIQETLTNPEIPLDRVERVMDMKREHDKSQALKSFNAAMADCQAEMPAILARNKNTQTNSTYATLPTIYAVAKPIASSYGLSFSTFPAPCEKERHLGVRWVLRHADGHIEEGVAEIPIDDRGMKGMANKTQTHAFGSSYSYARRYLFCMIFDIAIGTDDDGNAGGGRPVQPITSNQFIQIRDKAGELGIELSVIEQAEGIDDLRQLPAGMFQKVINGLNITEKKRAEAQGKKPITANIGESA